MNDEWQLLFMIYRRLSIALMICANIFWAFSGDATPVVTIGIAIICLGIIFIVMMLIMTALEKDE